MKKLLVVIDMQNDFIDGALGTKEAEAIVDRVVEKIGEYPKDHIYATRDTHGDDYLQTQEGEILPVVHCVESTHGWQINEKVAEALGGAVIVNKGTFGSQALADMLYLEAVGHEEVEIELVGLCTDICVVSNAILIKTRLPEAKVFVDASCCAGVTPESHDAALKTMQMCQCIVK
ncbi:cysteine hydrolase [Anaerotignum lactatifermentans]|uniref:nicotinamidase n=1 Tax=Anaerotignum lactatifermentans TaxID=160404 RepID=A0ABS2G6P8_9FIRM|nr:isochorismatase family cysteine hydrolase [Anaerotignum lactatifermentans]MBM6828035.1 cysteine hydrolase [Anaerotignum lactatifermentans]MBM6876802.1 cysteine hydrolase [Anaerotignum lactatifermentans]MBM6949618.1 cysteine hydrolase [Anaerotignum lactatifermentans]